MRKIYKFMMLALFAMLGGVGAYAQRNLTAADFNANCTYNLNALYVNWWDTYYGDGNNATANYADISDYGTLILKGTPSGVVRVFFNKGVSKEGDITTRIVTLNSSGYAEVDLTKVYNQDGYVRLNSIKHGSDTDSGTELTAIQVEEDKSVIGEVGVTATSWWKDFSNYYEVDLTADRDVWEFSFNVHGPASNEAYNDGQGWSSHNAWTLIGTNVKGHADVGDPKYVNAVEYFIAGPISTTGAYQGTLASSYPNAYNTDNFHQDMTDAEVSVKVTYTAGVLSIKATMKSNVYPNRQYVYTAQSPTNAFSGKLYLSFTKDHSYLSDFKSSHQVGNTTEWRIFEAPTISEQTWNGVRIHDDFEQVPTLWLNDIGEKREYYYHYGIPENMTYSYAVNGKVVFPGMGFVWNTAGHIRLSPKDYRIYVDNEAGIVLPNVPAGYYIWIEAESNSTGRGIQFDITRINMNSNGYNYEVVSGDKAVRGDGNTLISKKHMFSYKAWTGGSYLISPTNDCYVYYVAIVPGPQPVLSFGTSSYTKAIGETFTQTVAVECDMQGTTKPTTFSASDLTYTSDDPTVVKVNATTGEVTVVGAGTATITATLRKDAAYNYNGNLFTLIHPVTASYTVTVNEQSGTYRALQEADKKIKLWESQYSPNGVKVYLGGWKYQSSDVGNGNALADKYQKTVGTYVGESKDAQSDKWSNPATFTVGNETAKDYQSVPMDGFNYFTSHSSENGKSEFLYRNTKGSYLYEWPKRGGQNGLGNPFTVPVFGDFFKFEPEQDGVLTVYVLQNGSNNFDSDNNRLLKTVSWRPTYIVDEAGNRLEDVIAVTKQKVIVSPDDVTSDVYEAAVDKGKDGVLTMDGSKVATYAAQVEASSHYATHFSQTFNGVEFWPERGTVQQVWGPEVTGDGWVVVTKGYVKYQFPVKAGKSYYVFSNASKLGYCGSRFIPTSTPSATLTLTDNDNNSATTVAQAAGKSYAKVTFKRTFRAGWNAICLPFSVTESKMREWFGTDGKETYELVTYNGSIALTDEYLKAYFFHHAYQDIIAGYPYMLWIPEGAKAIQQGKIEVENVTIENVTGVTFSSSADYMPEGSGIENVATVEDFTFKGIYQPTTVPLGSYLVVTGGLQIYQQTTLGAFRSYLHPSYLDGKNDYNAVKRLSAQNFEDVLSGLDWNGVTAISEYAAERGFFDKPSNVYSVNGLLMRENATSLVGLPKGIYIVNGKKYIVK